MRTTMTTFRLLLPLAATGALLLLAIPARACPYCDSETGQQVRAGIFNDYFAENALLTLLPFPLLLCVVALIHFGLPSSWSSCWPQRRAVTPNRERSRST